MEYLALAWDWIAGRWIPLLILAFAVTVGVVILKLSWRVVRKIEHETDLREPKR